MAKTTKEEQTYIANDRKTYFKKECYLQERIKEQVEILFPGYQIFEDVNRIGIEYPIGFRKIDLLLENKKDGYLMAIELKSRIGKKTEKKPKVAGWREFGQISMYLALLIKKFKNRKIIKGCIIAPIINDGLRIAATTNEDITLYEYQTDKKGNIKLKLIKF